MSDLSTQTAFITGASGAIGSAIAKNLHKAGAYVYLSGSNLEKLEKLASQLGDNCAIIPGDLTNEDTTSRLLNDLEKLDILVCNAGITKDGLGIKMPLKDFEQVLQINLKANFILNQAAIKKMLKERYGRIINISSVVAISGNAGQANYCASKAGLIGMSKAFAQEVAARNITVNVVAPGFVSSDMTDSLSSEQQELIKQKIPCKRFGLPADIAHSVNFLASPEASYITGQTIHVNGGMLMV